MPSLKQLQHEYDSTRGLWCIDRHPADVDYEWIKKNAFQLKDYLKDGDVDEGRLTIGKFTLKQGSAAGKILMRSQSRDETEVDAKVLEDVLKSFLRSSSLKQIVHDRQANRVR
jgi:hypothetical protein